jgi:hypothetical protein
VNLIIQFSVFPWFLHGIKNQVEDEEEEKEKKEKEKEKEKEKKGLI